MAEGIVVMSVILGFLGLIFGTGKAYQMKLDKQQGTRSDALYTCSHAGSGGGGGIGVTAPNGASMGPNNGAAQITKRFNLEQATDQGSVPVVYVANTNAPNGSIAWGKKGFTSQVSAHSACVDNEPEYGSQLTAWVSFGMSLIGNLGGAGALFQ